MQQLKLQFRCKELKIGGMVRILSKHNDVDGTVWRRINWKIGDVGYVKVKEYGCYFLSLRKDATRSSAGHFKREDLEVIEYARS